MNYILLKRNCKNSQLSLFENVEENQTEGSRVIYRNKLIEGHSARQGGKRYQLTVHIVPMKPFERTMTEV